MRTQKIIYWIATGVMSLVFLFSIYIHLFNQAGTAAFYENLGFPTWMVYPSGIVKLLALIAIWTDRSTFLKEWAYAGLFFDAIMAFTAHNIAQDGAWLFSAIAIVTIIISRYLYGKVNLSRKD